MTRWLLFDLTRLEDPQERERLQRLLEERLQEVGQVSPPTQEARVAAVEVVLPDVPSYPESDFGQLLMRIEMLSLGPQATVEDLRTRDAIVAVIAGISDPVQREQLLKRLDEREQAASPDGTVLTPPIPLTDSN